MPRAIQPGDVLSVLHHIGGADADGLGEKIDIVNPATGEAIGGFRGADADQVAAAVAAARATFDSGIWARAPWSHRQAVLRKIATAIRADADTLAVIQMAETGFHRQKIAGHINNAAGWFDYYADYLSHESGETYQQTDGFMALVNREPVGVCALFAPWNVPVGLAAVKLAPALAAGNSVVLKPSELAPMVSRALVDLMLQAGLPEGVLNLVNGLGVTTGAALAAAEIDAISFTGGAAGGEAVAIAGARRNVPVALELGGKSATIVFADADFDAAVSGALNAIYSVNGEACLAGSRIILQREIAERFIDAFRCGAERMIVGDPADGGTDIGPMISAQHHAKVSGFFDTAATDGDILICGGRALPRQGFFIEPSAYVVASAKSRLWREEVFGPIAAFTIFDTEAEAVALANDSDYGLVAYLWTSDAARTLRVAAAIRAGSVMINSTIRRDRNAPFGGFKASGVGREGGRFSWDHFTEPKTIMLRHGPG